MNWLADDFDARLSGKAAAGHVCDHHEADATAPHGPEGPLAHSRSHALHPKNVVSKGEV